MSLVVAVCGRFRDGEGNEMTRKISKGKRVSKKRDGGENTGWWMHQYRQVKEFCVKVSRLDRRCWHGVLASSVKVPTLYSLYRTGTVARATT